MAALLRRPAAIVLIVASALLGLPALALAGGQDVLDDLKDNRIDGCYSRADFAAAIKSLKLEERLYSGKVEILNGALVRHAKGTDGTCGVPAPAEPARDDSGGDRWLWLGLGLGVGVVSVGAGWASRRRPAPGADE
ncbi:MAG: hypothetical protein AB7V42_13090 [Thermoleophilia bacterium]